MNVLQGKIESVKVKKGLSLVRIMVGQIPLTSIVLDTPETVSYLDVGSPVKVIFKETEVIIGSGSEHPISLQNKFLGKIVQLESGDLLSKVTMETTVGKITSIITTNAVNQLKLQIGSEVTAMVKTNETMLAE